MGSSTARHELVSSVVTVKLSPLSVHRAHLLWHIKYLPFFPPLDLKCTRIKLLRLGGEGAEGRGIFPTLRLKKIRINLPQHSQTQQENQKNLSNILFKTKTSHLQTRMTISPSRPCLQLLSTTNFRVCNRENERRLSSSQGRL